jgi:hypothetical protein
MVINKGKTLLKELREHFPFTLGASVVAGILVALVYSFWRIPSESIFEWIHPLHIFVSAAATAAIYNKYKKSLFGTIIIGVFGAILIGSLSDVLLPWITGNVFSLHTAFHLPIIESPLFILGVAIVGSLFGLYIGLFKLNHSLHVFFSIFASLFYILAFSIQINFWVILIISLLVFLLVFIPCCLSDIVFPLLFIKNPCKKCGYWHD